jgi:hypothetical protein
VVRLLPPLLAALCLLVCTNSSPPSPATTPSPPAPTPTPSPAIPTRPPSDLVLADADVGLARVSARDNVTITQAASEQQNQPLALTEYRQWGWVEESQRSWAGGSQRVDESLALLTRVEGAGLAFQGWAGELTQRSGCPDGPGLDECALGSAALVARVGRYTFRLSGTGVDFTKLAGAQAARIRKPS